MKTETVKIERSFLEKTSAGLVALKAYRDWKKTQKDSSGEGSKLLKELGLAKEPPKKIEGGLAQRVLNALDGSEGMTLPALVESIAATLAEEGNGESVTLPQVRACVNFQLKVGTKKIPEPRVIEKPKGVYKSAYMDKPITSGTAKKTGKVVNA